MRISTSLPDGKWREVADAARAFEELGFDEAAAHEVQHNSFATLVPATLSTHKIGLTTSVAIAFPRSPMIVAILAQDLNVNSNGRFVLGLGSQVKQHNERRFSTPCGHVMGKTKSGEASNGATSPDVAPHSVFKITAGLIISSPVQVQETRPG